MQSVMLSCSYINQELMWEEQSCDLRRQVRVGEISLKKVGNLLFQLLLSPKLSLTANHGGRYF